MKKLSNRQHYRIRVGGFRILIEMDDTRSVIHVLSVRPRGDAYGR